MKWRKTVEELPEVEVGDRVLCAIQCRVAHCAPMQFHIFVLTATEDGWESEDGWSIEDAELWTFEKEETDSLHRYL